jgi:hypothetical protein
MTGTRLRWAACAVLAVVAAVLAGSMLHDHDPPAPAAAVTRTSSTGAPTPGGTATTDPTIGPTPGGTTPSSDADGGPPRRPDAALGLTVGSAEALVRFYFEQAENYLKLTGDGTSVRAVSSPACRPCLGEIPLFVETIGRNKRLTGDYLWKHVEVRAVRSTGARSVVVDVDVRRGRHAAIEKPGARPTLYTGGLANLKLTLVADGTDWVVFDKALR